MSAPILLLRYSTFAVISIAVNLAVQRGVFLMMHDSIALFPALMSGTISALIVKYVLDKRWIFNDFVSGIRSHTRKFSLYTLMGVFTTMIFWGFEAGFWLLWRTELMRNAGALVGLCIGYIVKYQLDRRFVFIDATLQKEPSA
jgi:putative flippase GtrA